MAFVETRDFIQVTANNGKTNFSYIFEGNEDERLFNSKIHKSKMKYYSKEAIKEIEEWSKKGYGIYFLPNGGGYRNDEITEFRACFIDMDIKDEIEHEIIAAGFTGSPNELQELVKSKFYSLNSAEKTNYKQIFRSRVSELKQRGIPPSAIVETKNGFHVYYLLNNDTQRHQFETLEGFLIYIFNADMAVKNPARLLRVPDTLHLKDPNDPFTIKLEEWNRGIRYDAEDLIVRLRTVIEKVSIEADSQLCVNSRKAPTHNTKLLPKKRGLPSRIAIDYSSMDVGNIPLISKGFKGLPELKRKLELDNQDDLCYIDRDDIRQFLKRQNLKHLLGIDSDRFYCIFHNSSNSTSGNIYSYDDKWFYKCHSSRCGVHYDIVQIIERISRLPIHKAFDYLKELYNIAEIKTEWQLDQERLIEFNIEFLERFKYDMDLQENYPYLTKFLKTKGTLGLLIQIHEVARRKLPQLAKMRNMDSSNAIVFAPMRKVIEELLSENSDLRNINKANTKVVIMIFMYLLNCVGVDQLPIEMQRGIEQYQKESRKNNIIHYNNIARYYEIVSMDTERLILAEEMSKFFYQNHLTISNFNREQLISLCGVEEGNRVFPDRSEEEIPGLNQSISKEISRVVNNLIWEKGWTHESEIIEHMDVSGFSLKQLYRDNFKYIPKKKSVELDSIAVLDNDVGFQKWSYGFLAKKLSMNIPAIISNQEYRKARVNKLLRKQFDIPIHIKGFVYHQEISEQGKQLEDKASHILRLKQHDLSLSNAKIASLVGCSRQYVSNVLKCRD
ncbi:hypothetical protein [Paenibacillus terrae]|uniref:Uncharacterized protein n=1 Tax=Paenibacillus terrae TaxID=159743 RepID=A0A0D7X5J8_9BACL|nr:hypothetical protein [Paenibacillus terrae]KJD46696.1 hypothetical protein QD47_05425 [Paenibacillus terrae]